MELGGCGNFVSDNDFVAVAPQLLVTVTETVPELKLDGTLIVIDVPVLAVIVHELGFTQLYETAPVTGAIE